MSCIGIINKETKYVKFEFSQNWAEMPVIGNFISTTTANISYCSMSHQYTKCDAYVEAFAIQIGSDYTQYNHDFCRNAGAYGYDFYIINGIVFTETEELESF